MQLLTEETFNTVVDYSEQLNQLVESVNSLINISNNVLSVNFVFMNLFILFGICSLIYLFFKNF